jgi:membrane protein implicated in regulation of membrane protease activity
MLRRVVFSRVTGVAGVLAGVTGLVPASFGTLGFALSFISLLPLVVWLVLIGRRLFEFVQFTPRNRTRNQPAGTW